MKRENERGSCALRAHRSFRNSAPMVADALSWAM